MSLAQIRVNYPKEVETYFYNEDLAAGASKEVIKSTTFETGMSITFRVVYNNNATAGGKVYYLYSTDGTHFDSKEDALDAGNYFEPTFAKGAIRQRTEVIQFAPPTVKILVENLDSVYELKFFLDVSIIY